MHDKFYPDITHVFGYSLKIVLTKENKNKRREPRPICSIFPHFTENSIYFYFKFQIRIVTGNFK